ncbi:MAG: serine/threonine-protein kinase [Planctomycetota bacterium]
MKLVEGCVAERLSQWNRRSSDARFGDFVGECAAGDWDEDAWADLIRADVQQRLLIGLPVTLGEYVELPEIAGSTVLVDTAISAVLQALLARGKTRTAALAAIRAENPTWANAITTAEVLSSLLGSGVEPVRVETKLPRRMGPPGADGQPRYELTHRIGSGSHATVYRALDHDLGTDERPAWVAVKLVGGQRDQNQLRRLLAEAERARQVTHPGVIPIYDAGCTPEADVYIVSPVFDGRTLAEMVEQRGERGSGWLRVLVTSIHDACDGLQAVHNAGLLHCDIKPTNILMDQERRTRIADFGMSVWTRHDESQEGAQTTAAAGGTLGFMAPEQWAQSRGWRRPAVDTYAMGATLLWCLTGQTPHGKDRAEAERALTAAGAHAMMLQSRIVHVRDPELRRIVSHALAFDPFERYQTPAALAADLRAWLAGEPVEWMHLGLARRFSLWRKRSPAQVVALGALVLATAAIPVSILWAQSRVNAAEIRNATDRADAADQRFELGQKMFSSSMKTFAANRDEKWKDGSMPSFLILETIHGPKFFDQSGLLKGLWDNRIEEARRLEEASPFNSIEYLNWRLLEGTWLLQSEQFGEALTVLNGANEGWRSICTPDDPWLLDAEALRSSALVLAVSKEMERATLAHEPPREPTMPSGGWPDMATIEGSLQRVLNDPRPTRRLYYLAKWASEALNERPAEGQLESTRAYLKRMVVQPAKSQR